jgi:haloalkane dehalogenase
MSDVLRTPDERFSDLPQFPYAPRYATVDGLRMHYVDEGPRDAAPVLLLHGEPSWCFLYRRMIPPLLGAGLRVVAPDLIGFGRSDKPARREEYTYARHVGWVGALIDQLDLRGATLFGQDWGGLIGLRLAAEKGERFARICAGNTGLPTGDERVPLAFKAWRAFSQLTPVLPVSRIVRIGCRRPMTPEVAAAYDAPFPGEAHKAGARQFPMLVPTSPSDPATIANRAAWDALGRWEKPFLCAFSDGDPVTRGAERRMQKRIPGCAGQPHTTIRGAGHFLQEDSGEELGAILARWIKS